MRRRVVVAGAICALIAAVGPTGGAPAKATGQDAVCADRCEGVRDLCNVKCQEPPKDAKKPAESTQECVKTCNVDPKHESIASWTPKETACIQACVRKLKPCMQTCRTQYRSCLSHCQN